MERILDGKNAFELNDQSNGIFPSEKAILVYQIEQSLL
jgi:hypothetical protein